MATSKLLKPTNVTISIPAFTDQPDQRVNSNCIDKEADAINSLSEQIGTLNSKITFQNITSQVTKNTNYVGNSDTKVFKSANMVIISLNFELTSNASIYTELFSNLPRPLTPGLFGSIAKSDGTSMRIRIRSTGILDNEDAMTTGWYDGNLCYPI